MQMPEVLSPVLDLGNAVMGRFVQLMVQNEWIGRSSLVLVTPGEGLDAKAFELADTVGLDVGTLKVRVHARVAAKSIQSGAEAWLLSSLLVWWVAVESHVLVGFAFGGQGPRVACATFPSNIDALLAAPQRVPIASLQDRGVYPMMDGAGLSGL